MNFSLPISKSLYYCRLSFVLFFIVLLLQNCKTSDSNLNIVKKWDTLTLNFEGDEVDENDEFNPFLNYRLEVVFTHKEATYNALGYFAADGNAAETSATKGKIWRVKFTPNKLGEWNYKVIFKKGEDVIFAKDLGEEKWESVGEDGKTGTFNVVEGNFSEKDFRSKGQLEMIQGADYQRFAEKGEYFIKGGCGSPENLLAYKDFDGTYAYNPEKQFLKTYEPHIKDWKVGDPTWQNGKGKGLIGGLNYLASKGMNAIYFLSMNIEGDGQDVWPYTAHDDYFRFDCSKLDQWEIVFEHAQKNGIVLHFVTQETENELLFDNGDLGKTRKLYYRELIARYGHHLAVTWNMGEENGSADFSPKGQSTEQRESMFEFFQQNNSKNLVALHSHSTEKWKDDILMDLLGNQNLDAISFQVDRPDKVHSEILRWKKLAKDAGHPWLINMDEIGPYWQGALPDSFDIAHDTLRSKVIWGSLMAGGGGVEWYFGYKYPHADLTCEDWRLREKLWEQTHHAVQFFNHHLPFWEMENRNELLQNTKGYCFAKEGEVYVVYLPKGNENVLLQVPDLEGKKITISWFHPRNGGDLMNEKEIEASQKIELGAPPKVEGLDWVALIKVK